MTSTVFRVSARALMPVLLGFSFFVLVRGHNEPGGGFVGGLVAAAGFALEAIAFGVASAARALRVSPLFLIGAGLSTSGLAGTASLITGQPFLTARGFSFQPPVGGNWEFGTVLMFDVGVYMVVLGSVLLIVLSLAAEE